MREARCGRAPVGERLVPPGRPGSAELTAELVIDEVAELVQEAERDPAVTPRDPHIDGILFAAPVTAALARRRRRAHGYRVEVGDEEMERVGGCKRLGQVGIQRASPGQPDDLRETAKTGLSAASHGKWVPALGTSSRYGSNPDAADNRRVRILLILLVPVMLFSGVAGTPP